MKANRSCLEEDVYFTLQCALELLCILLFFVTFRIFFLDNSHTQNCYAVNLDYSRQWQTPTA
jgi:hypothetical protein